MATLHARTRGRKTHPRTQAQTVARSGEIREYCRFVLRLEGLDSMGYIRGSGDLSEDGEEAAPNRRGRTRTDHACDRHGRVVVPISLPPAEEGHHTANSQVLVEAACRAAEGEC